MENNKQDSLNGHKEKNKKNMKSLIKTEDYDNLGYLMKYSMDKQKESNKPEKLKKAFDKGVEKEMDKYFKNK